MPKLKKTDWSSVDPQEKMLHWIRDLPDQILDAMKTWPEVEEFDVSPMGVAVAAMGGSAMAAEVALLSLSSGIVSRIIRSETLPGWVDNRWLFLACSYSGDTGETLSCFREAVRRDCSIATMSSGGELRELSAEHEYSHRELEPGQPPITALGQAVVGSLHTLWSRGLAADPREDLEASAKTMKTLLSEGLAASDPWNAKAGVMAEQAVSGFSVIVGAGITSPAALRWAQQLNENAKLGAFHLELPEMLHNQVEALVHAATRGACLFLLKDNVSQTRAERAALDRLSEDFRNWGGKAFVLESVGEGKLERIFSLMYVGDQVSYLAALLQGVDPTPVERIGRLKRMLTDGKGIDQK